MGSSIYFVALITRDNRPLHLQTFNPNPTPKTSTPEFKANEMLKYNFLSNMSLDIFSSVFYEPGSLDQTCVLLFVEDGISCYGYETNTGLKIVIGTGNNNDNIGKQLDGIFKNVHKAYLRLICNPFQPLDENNLMSSKKLEKSIIEVVDVWNNNNRVI